MNPSQKLSLPEKVNRGLSELEVIVREFLRSTSLDERRDLWHRLLWTQEMLFNSIHCYALKVRGPLTNWLGKAIKERKKDKTVRYVSALRGYFEHSDQDGVILLNPKVGWRVEIDGRPTPFDEVVARGMLGILRPDPPKTARVFAEGQLSLPMFISRGVAYSPPTLDLNILAKRVLEYNQDVIREVRKRISSK